MPKNHMTTFIEPEWQSFGSFSYHVYNGQVNIYQIADGYVHCSLCQIIFYDETVRHFLFLGVFFLCCSLLSTLLMQTCNCTWLTWMNSFTTIFYSFLINKSLYSTNFEPKIFKSPMIYTVIALQILYLAKAREREEK